MPTTASPAENGKASKAQNMVAAKVDDELYKDVNARAKALGLSVTDYLKALIRDDLGHASGDGGGHLSPPRARLGAGAGPSGDAIAEMLALQAYSLMMALKLPEELALDMASYPLVPGIKGEMLSELQARVAALRGGGPRQ